jgi:hypothetical protein
LSAEVAGNISRHCEKSVKIPKEGLKFLQITVLFQFIFNRSGVSGAGRRLVSLMSKLGLVG